MDRLQVLGGGRKGAIMADIINQEQRTAAITGGSGRLTAGTNALIADHQDLLGADERGTD